MNLNKSGTLQLKHLLHVYFVNHYVQVSDIVIVASEADLDKFKQSLINAYPNIDFEDIDGKLYVIGGSDASGPLSTVESYDPVTDTWTTEPSLLAPRASHAGEGIDGKLYVAVGSGSLLDTLHVYDPSPTPETPSELIGSIEDLGLPSKVENNLKAPLKNAQDKLDDNNPKNDGAACGKMDAFINMVNAQEGKKLSTDQADDLREAAQSVKDSIGC